MKARGTLTGRTPCAPTFRKRNRTVARSSLAVWLVGAILILGPGCFVFVSTGPSHIEDATIVFVVKDDHGALVAHVRIEVVAIATEWRTEGSTRVDGAFRCKVERSVEQVRVGVTPPDGYALIQSDRWPRTLTIGAGVEETVEVRVRRLWPN